jgi:subtilisin family serine protease
MLRILIVLVAILPNFLGAQSPIPEAYCSSWASNPKVGNSLKIWSNPDKRSLFYLTDENKIALTGGFSGSKEAMLVKLSEISNHFNIFQRVFTIEIDPQSINELLSWEEVVFLDAATRFNAPRPLDDKALTKSNVQAAQSLNFSGIRGDNVVIGIVDVGFQTTHPTFFNEDGTVYRVKRFWQQKYKNQMGPAPYGYGILKNSEKEILEAVDTDGSHGTHVAGIAGGSGFKSPELKYAGVAPESELVFVGISIKDYENLSLNLAEIQAFLKKQNQIIIYYEDAIQNNGTEPEQSE